MGAVLDRPYSYAYLIASLQLATHEVVLHSINISHPDPAAGCTVTIYDSATGVDPARVVAKIAMDSAIFVIPNTLIFDIRLSRGLYVDFSAGFTVGAITISWT